MPPARITIEVTFPLITVLEIIQLLRMDKAFSTTIQLEPYPTKKANDCDTDNNHTDGVFCEHPLRRVRPTEVVTTIDDSEKNHDEPKVTMHNSKYGRGLRLFVQFGGARNLFATGQGWPAK
ncbi:hypothetical protein PEBR_38424 [Penicillium brasilianum]|uniref:Uncharacterized protein n=1 Tax=Penicillium brasilianum TaxID=104259 RepID=A0A1S9RCQ2_PENBI|nr:hypothetical protein PEBR_38424 [Penicillium brasilianum]